MKLLDAQNLLALRLYDWSLQDFKREIKEDFPLLSLVGLNKRYVTAFVMWVKTLSVFEREILAKNLIRRAHQNAAALRGESLSEQEMSQLNAEVFRQVTMFEKEFPPLVFVDERIDPDKCLDFLKLFLRSELGKPVRRKSGLFVTQKFGDWKLITEFTFYRRDKSLCFEYQFIRKDGTRWIGHGGPFPRNLFWLYGLCHTFVDVQFQKDVEPIAKTMAKLAEHLVVQAEPLFAGLGMSD